MDITGSDQRTMNSVPEARGVSPFGTRNPMPVYVEATVLTMTRMFINGGKRGFMLEMDPADLCRLLSVTEVIVAVA